MPCAACTRPRCPLFRRPMLRAIEAAAGPSSGFANHRPRSPGAPNAKRRGCCWGAGTYGDLANASICAPPHYVVPDVCGRRAMATSRYGLSPLRTILTLRAHRHHSPSRPASATHAPPGQAFKHLLGRRPREPRVGGHGSHAAGLHDKNRAARAALAFALWMCFIGVQPSARCSNFDRGGGTGVGTFGAGFDFAAVGLPGLGLRGFRPPMGSERHSCSHSPAVPFEDWEYDLDLFQG
jgi:hypothetical protein